MAVVVVPTIDRPTADDRIRAALWFAERGFGVFPVWSTDAAGHCRCPKGADCDNAGKHPVTAQGFKDATLEAARIRTFLAAGSEPNYGLVCPDGVFALDVDGEGVAVLDRLERELGPLPATLTTATAHGQHIFLSWPAALPRPIGQLFGFVTRWGAGRDAGYVIGPRSVHASGAVYTPAGDAFEIAELPETWAQRAVSAHAPTRDGQPMIVVGGGVYIVPDRIPAAESRYKAILAYTASRYNSGLSPEELWAGVRDVLAPRFELPLSEDDLRSRFERATKGLTTRLGERRTANASTPVVVATDLDAAPLTEFDSRPVEWCWPGWLPKGVVTIMDGNPGVSKSTLVADLAARLTTGGEWPDGTPIGSPQRVMWITTEDDPGRVLRPRIEAAGGDPSKVLFVRSEVVFPAARVVFRELLEKYAAEPEGLALVVLDPLFSHIEATVRTIADAEMRRGVMNPLNEAAEAADVAMLVVRHFSKDTAASAINRGAGSLGGIMGAARAAWGVTADPDDETGDTKVVGVSKLNYAKAPPALRYAVVDRLPPGWISGSVSGIEWLGEAPISLSAILIQTGSTRDAQAALEEILAGGPMGAEDVFAQMRSRGYSKDVTRSARVRIRALTRKTGMSGGWEWSLRDDDAPTFEGMEDGSNILRPIFEDTEGTRRHSSRPPSDADELSHTGAGAHTRGAAPPSVSSVSSGDVTGDEGDDPAPKIGKIGKMRRPPRPRSRTHAASTSPGAVTVDLEEGRAPTPVTAKAEWAKACRDYVNHRFRHRRTADGWVCDACIEEDSQ